MRSTAPFWWREGRHAGVAAQAILPLPSQSCWAELITLDDNNAARYYLDMIRSFHDKDTERVLNRERVRKFGPDVQRLAQRKLAILDAAENLVDLRFPPGNRLEKLAGDRKGAYSIRINSQWRICFRWRNPDAYDVEIPDYHY